MRLVVLRFTNGASSRLIHPTRSRTWWLRSRCRAYWASKHRRFGERKRAEIAAQMGMAIEDVRLDDSVPFDPARYRYFGMPRWWAKQVDGKTVWLDYAAVPASAIANTP